MMDMEEVNKCISEGLMQVAAWYHGRNTTSGQGWARDVNGRDRDETETRRLQVSRRDRDVEVHVYYH